MSGQIKVSAYYTCEPDSHYTTAYLEDEPVVGSVHFGTTKHTDQRMTATYVPQRDRWEVVWMEPFDKARYI